MIHALIMAGGTGTRFWPASRRARPKQLLALSGQRTMIQETVDRLEGLTAPENVLIITNQQLVDAIREQVPQVPASQIVGEPCKRDTAPCVGLAALQMLKSDPEATMVVMPSDHVIRPAATFRQALTTAVDFVERNDDAIVTFGIQPTYPATSFGYIEGGETLESTPMGDVQRIKTFREKPNSMVAAEYIASGTYYWNAGIFVMKAKTVVEALRKFEPEMLAGLERIEAARGTPQAREVFDREFESMTGKAIDIAVMERYDRAAVMAAPFQWDDLGNWQALGRMVESDENANARLGSHVAIRTRNCIVRTEDDHLIVTVGVEDLIVVHTDDATLVARRFDEESLRDVVKTLEAQGYDRYL